jgi:hypothetical protein
VSSSLDELLRTTLAARSVDAPDAAGLLDDVRRHVTRRRRRNTLAVTGLAAASVVAVIAAVAFVVAGGHSSSPSPATQPVITVTTPPPPNSTTPSSAPPTTATTAARAPVGVSLHSVDWNAVTYPIAPRCAPVGVRGAQVVYPSPAPGAQLAAVLAECNAGAGTPPVVLYVYDGASSPRTPHLAATLVSDSDDWQASTLTTSGATLRLPVRGFSSTSVPNCCPDVQTTLVWQWNGSGYRLVSTVPPHVKLPGA